MTPVHELPPVPERVWLELLASLLVRGDEPAHVVRRVVAARERAARERSECG